VDSSFDRVNHDILIGRLQKRIGDPGVIRLIRAYLNSGIMADGVVQERVMGTPHCAQVASCGSAPLKCGPLSPLLANVLLDEVDKELERRGHCFVRYADDANVYVRSRKAGERVMVLLRRLYGKLHLTVNEAKSAVASVFGRKFLGYTFWVAPGGVIKRRVADKPMATFKQRIRQLTRRSGGRGVQDVVDRLRLYVLGWKAYFRLAQTPRVFKDLDKWMRHRLRAVQLKQWKRGKTMYRELLALGAKPDVARKVAANSRRWWRNSGMLLNAVLTLKWADKLGMARLS
jgi:RNA-directed DNA polymerase